ncbi:ephrin type-B receptor 3-like [Sycon ciliatum]|uniref:ephrin type-B receptor 3-like n=1 Tax=Sycon ciliatum TaxID=27933 RepID=UPI0031F6C272
MVILELMSGGILRSYLHQLMPRSGVTLESSVPGHLLQMSIEIARGMSYLAKRQFIHRDLAARNILLDSSHVCKIGDFGMSRNLADDTYYESHGGKIPYKWTAPEAMLYRKYSLSSDVWSYGIVLYEIFTLGKKPYFGMQPQQVISFVSEERRRLPPPPGVNAELYKVMLDCWHPDHRLRPRFDQLTHRLSRKSPFLAAQQRTAGIPEQAYTVGSPLQASQNMHRDLQMRFCQ